MFPLIITLITLYELNAYQMWEKGKSVNKRKYIFFLYCFLYCFLQKV